MRFPGRGGGAKKLAKAASFPGREAGSKFQVVSASSGVVGLLAACVVACATDAAKCQKARRARLRVVLGRCTARRALRRAQRDVLLSCSVVYAHPHGRVDSAERKAVQEKYDNYPPCRVSLCVRANAQCPSQRRGPQRSMYTLGGLTPMRGPLDADVKTINKQAQKQSP